MNLFNRQFKVTILLLILVEELSFLGYLLPMLNGLFFWLIVILALGLAVWRLESAVWLVLIELMIGSKGYLFFAELFGAKISIRIALWSIVMLVWLAKTLVVLIREKKAGTELRNFFLSLKAGERRSLALLALCVSWGFLNGLLLTRNGLSDTFLDFNGWLFFLLIFPLSSVLKNRENFDRLLPLLAAAVVWLAGKTFFMAFIFSHATMDSAAFRLYRWVRVSGVGEITQVKGGFFRIFFQSQIYSLFSLLLLSVTLVGQIIKSKISNLLISKNFWLNFAGLGFLLTVLLFSMSRSFWLGLAAGWLLLIPYLYLETKKINQSFLKKAAASAMIFLAVSMFGVALTVLTVTFPIPPAIGGFDAGSLLSSRLDSDEAAVISRWELLPKLWQKILSAPVLGAGFGDKLTYRSSDPRQQLSPNHGIFTTYAFEWGWLDIWLKLGFVGLSVYLVLLYQLAKNAFQNKVSGLSGSLLTYGLFCSLIALTVVNFFSPYLNHPLGIGFLVFLFAISQNSVTAHRQ